MCGTDIFLGVIAIIFPPIAVWVKRGICSADSLINLALCVLGFLPGLFHAWYIIFNYPEPTYEELAQQDTENGRVTYYYIQQGSGPNGGQRQAPQGYGTVNAPQGSSAQYQQPARMEGGPSNEAPPTYQESVRGDNKVQH